MAGSPRVRTAFVALSVAALVAVGAWTLSAAASSPPALPGVQPQELVASVIRAMRTEPGVSGHVDTHADLGIPDLSSGPLAGQVAPGGLGALASFLGDHHLRVWSSSDGLRISDQLATGERSIFVDASNGQAWAWDWQSFTAVRLASADSRTAADTAHGAPPMAAMDPQLVAQRALETLTPTTAVTMGAPERVAGRAAYVLVLRPRTTETLVGQVEIAVDAARRIPLRIAVTARGASSPALSATFTSVRFGAVDPAVYAFSPPRGARVEEGRGLPMFAGGATSSAAAGTGGGADEGIAEYARTFGHGWTTVVAFRLPAAGTPGAGPGNVIVSGSLLSLRLVDRGDHRWLVYGAVPQPALAAVEDQLP
jgi:hypothetical protein